MSVLQTPPRNSCSSLEDESSGAEADDVTPRKPNFVQQLLQRMSPSHCLSGGDADTTTGCHVVGDCHNPLFDDGDVEEIAVSLLKDIQKEGKLRTVALQKLYRLTDRERKHHRVPLVCTTRLDTIGALLPCISSPTLTDRRKSLLILNNLCIPVANKAAILLGEPLQPVVTALLDVIRQRQAESYLAAVCLFNLSFLQDGKALLFSFVPTEPPQQQPQSSYRHYAPTDNPISLLRTLESGMQEFLPYVITANSDTDNNGDDHHPPVKSVERQAVRWCMGLFRNLASAVPEHAVTLARHTRIPAMAIACLHDASLSIHLNLWTRDSLMDASLMLLVHIAQHDATTLRHTETDMLLQVLERLHGRGGIHETRAMALLKCLTGSNKEVVDEQDEKKER